MNSGDHSDASLPLLTCSSASTLASVNTSTSPSNKALRIDAKFLWNGASRIAPRYALLPSTRWRTSFLFGREDEGVEAARSRPVGALSLEDFGVKASSRACVREGV